MTAQAVFALQELITATSRDNGDNISSPSTTHRYTGLSRIQKERLRFAKTTKKSPDFIIASALSVMEMCLNAPVTLSKESLEFGLRTLLESFQTDLVDLCKCQAVKQDDVKASRQFIKDTSQAHEITLVGYVPIPTVAEAFLLKPLARSAQFRHKAALLEDTSPQAKRMAQKLLAEIKTPKKMEFILHQLGQRLVSPTYDFLQSTRDDITHHCDVIERDFAIRTLEHQIQRFYQWRGSDDYTQMINAYARELRHQARIEKHLQMRVR